jgi:GNAT superfamily N-acetyltransferase
MRLSNYLLDFVELLCYNFRWRGVIDKRYFINERSFVGRNIAYARPDFLAATPHQWEQETMDIQVRRAEYADVESMRDLYRQEANCQIIHDASLRRKMADPYLILVDGRVGGYGAVWNQHDPGRLSEFYVLPHLRPFALPMYRELLAVSAATSVEAQTNMPLMLLMLYDCGKNITTDAILFEDAITTHLQCPTGLFRRTKPEEKDIIFPHASEPIGDWVVEAKGTIVATGGYFSHYNPPFGDVYMEAEESARKQGYGSYLVQEVKRLCYESGKKPAARTGVDNLASRATLQKAGFRPCARLLVAEVN